VASLTPAPVDARRYLHEALRTARKGALGRELDRIVLLEALHLIYVRWRCRGWSAYEMQILDRLAGRDELEDRRHHQA
jgi:hypothetical protein